MGEREYLIGIDVGTSSAKGFVFDYRGNIQEGSHYEYDIIKPNPGWKEQKAEVWWDGVREIGNELMEKAPLSRDNLAGIGITHQRMTFVPVDEEIEPIDKAILWNDTRCGDEIDEVNEEIGGDEVFRKTGTSPGLWTIYKILWLKKNKPKIYKEAHKFPLVPDYLTYKLTGNLLTTESAAILAGIIDITDVSEWNSGLLEELDVDENKMVTPIRPSGEIAGEITEKASKKTSLPQGTPVMTAAGDQPCGSLGAGLVEKNKTAINGGTSCTTEVLVDDLPPREKSNYYLEIPPAGGYLLETSVYSGGSALMNWYKNNFGADEVQKAKEKGMNTWTYIYNKAKEVPPGNLGMLLVPYFDGAGPPYWDADATGIMLGLTLDHKSSHLIRSIMEGLALEVRRNISVLEESISGKVNEAIMYGGSSQSDVWNQVFSDVLGVGLSVPETAETTALGAAICAAVGSDMYSSVKEAAVKMVRKESEYNPRKEEKQMYSDLYDEAYKEIYERVDDLIKNAKKISMEP